MVSPPAPPENQLRILDLRGLKCPMPALLTRKALRSMAPGEPLVVLCTDAMAAIDIPHLCRETGDALEEQGALDGVLRFSLRKGPDRLDGPV